MSAFSPNQYLTLPLARATDSLHEYVWLTWLNRQRVAIPSLPIFILNLQEILA